MKKVFYINKTYILAQGGEFNKEIIPISIRRRLSLVDKIAFAGISAVFTDNVSEIVFSSKFGEIERLDKLISEYTEFNEVSPNKFSGSVHNYPVSAFCLEQGLNMPYHAISSGDNSISSAILLGVCLDKDVVVCYADSLPSSMCVAVNISACKGTLNAIKCELTTGNFAQGDEFSKFERFLTAGVDFIAPQFVLKRID